MKYFLAILLYVIGFSAVLAQFNEQEGIVGDNLYSYKNPEPDGTGKVYMGREIGSLKIFQKKGRPALSRLQEESMALAINDFALDKNSVVADIGAGSGIYAFPIARRVPQGMVYAVEIQDDALNFMEEWNKKLKFKNVQVHKGDEKSPNLPYHSLDLAFMVDVYHELLYPHEMLEEIKNSLKPNGRLILIEYRGEDQKLNINNLHKMTVAQIVKELAANGFQLIQNRQYMHGQHFLVFEKDLQQTN